MTLLPGLTWHEVPAWLAGANAVIVPSHADTVRLVTLEATAAGTPLVVLRSYASAWLQLGIGARHFAALL
ncbi:glycosyltransferase [Micromonospora sp. NPDC002717]|uniref:glycosyltransferase n=1 Tax=Micromonospora sp. NPDC002717 TaxID=3154424 RepID=UPI0033238E31